VGVQGVGTSGDGTEIPSPYVAYFPAIKRRLVSHAVIWPAVHNTWAICTVTLSLLDLLIVKLFADDMDIRTSALLIVAALLCTSK